MDYQPSASFADAPLQICRQTADVVESLAEPLAAVGELDQLICALREADLWDRIGNISWARDTQGGLLLLWKPAAGTRPS